MPLNQHDKIVLRVAKELLKKGSDSITIGDRVEDRLKIAKSLKKSYPKAKIFTYYENYKIQFTAPEKITILGEPDILS